MHKRHTWDADRNIVSGTTRLHRIPTTVLFLDVGIAFNATPMIHYHVFIIGEYGVEPADAEVIGVCWSLQTSSEPTTVSRLELLSWESSCIGEQNCNRVPSKVQRLPTGSKIQFNSTNVPSRTNFGLPNSTILRYMRRDFVNTCALLVTI